VSALDGAGPGAVGGYVIHDEIACGGMASVHFARPKSGDGPVVAVKRAHPHLAREHDFALMFLDEARLASRVRHPNVVATVDVLHTDADLLLVMEYVHGESLFRLVRAATDHGARVPLPIAVAVVVGALRGLHAAHEAVDERGGPLGLVHRDVSPQNILVGVDGVARIVDFGIAKAAGRLHSTRDSSVKGKYGYMAPEQVHGEPVGRATDTYAASIVLWELLTGERLFAGKTDAETIHKCLVARAAPPSRLVPEVPPALDAVVRKGLSRDVAERYATAGEMADDVERAASPAAEAEVGAWVRSMAGPSLAKREELLAAMEQRGTRERQVTAAEALVTAPRPRPRRIIAASIVAGLVGAIAVGTLATRRPAVRSASPAAAPVVASTPAEIAPEATVGPPPTSAPASLTAASSSAAVEPAAGPAPSIHAAHAPARVAPPSRSTHAKRKACDPPYSIDADGRQIFKPECM
jgi:serine/threonine-protein kinase